MYRLDVAGILMVIFQENFEISTFPFSPTVFTTMVRYIENTGAVTYFPKPHHGTYGVNIEQQNLADVAQLYKDFPSTRTVYARVNIKNQKLPPLGTPNVLFELIGGLQSLIRFGVKNTAGVYTWRIFYYHNGGFIEFTTAMSTSPLNWNCVELMAKCNTGFWTSDGAYQVWVNGTSIFSLSPANTAITYGVSRVQIDEAGTPPLSAYFDCLVVDTQYIGPEVEGSPLIISQTHEKTTTSEVIAGDCTRLRTVRHISDILPWIG